MSFYYLKEKSKPRLFFRKQIFDIVFNCDIFTKQGVFTLNLQFLTDLLGSPEQHVMKLRNTIGSSITTSAGITRKSICHISVALNINFISERGFQNTKRGLYPLP